MPQTTLVNPFRCKMWDLHDRLEHLIAEESCRAEIVSFTTHGQLIAALGRPLKDDPDHDVELIYGARRLFVARHLNAQLLVEIREVSDREAVVAMDIENRQRQEISPYERGLSFARCLRAGHFDSQDDLAKALKISQSQVSRLLTLARLPSVVVSAFDNPLEIREAWGLDLAAALQDTRMREPIIIRARVLESMRPKLNAMDVYLELVSSSAGSRKVRTRLHDEVITDSGGAPLFRIRIQEKMIAVLLPRDKTSKHTLSEVRDAIREVLQDQYGPRATSSKRAEKTPALSRIHSKRTKSTEAGGVL
jgi:ParB family chromosome partitioning protein